MKTIADLRKFVGDNHISYNNKTEKYSSTLKEVKASDSLKSRVVDSLTTYFMRSSKGEERRITHLGNDWKTIEL